MNQKIILALVGCCVFMWAHTAMAAPVQWTVEEGGNGHWYELVWDHENWVTARQSAMNRVYDGCAGYLATLTSSEEEVWVRQNLALAFTIWIGGHIDADLESWSWWSTGEPYEYQNWENGVVPQGTDLGMRLTPTAWGAEFDSFPALHYLVEYSPAPVSTDVERWGSLKAIYR